MRMSGCVTVTLLGGLMLTSCLTSRGCGHHTVSAPPDRTWYDANGQPIAEHWATGPDGKRYPDPHPYDRYGNPWVLVGSGEIAPPPVVTHYHSSYWWWGGSGYRSYGTGPTYHSGTPAPTAKPASPPASSSSITRGGFGSTGASANS